MVLIGILVYTGYNNQKYRERHTRERRQVRDSEGRDREQKVEFDGER